MSDRTNLVWRLIDLDFVQNPRDPRMAQYEIKDGMVWLYIKGFISPPPPIAVGPDAWWGSEPAADMMIAKALAIWQGYPGDHILIPQATRSIRGRYYEMRNAREARQTKTEGDNLQTRLMYYKERKRQAFEYEVRHRRHEEAMTRKRTVAADKRAAKAAAWPLAKQRRSNVNWNDMVPHNLAAEQVAWERARTIVAMRDAGWTLAKIGEKFGLSRGRVQQIEFRGRKPLEQRSPVEIYWSRPTCFDGRETKRLKQTLPYIHGPKRDWLLVA